VSGPEDALLALQGVAAGIWQARVLAAGVLWTPEWAMREALQRVVRSSLSRRRSRSRRG
jgi:hypothetical protein